MFGQPTTPFASPAGGTGSASPFGAPAPTAGGFGAGTSPAPFGSPAPAPAAGGFGGFGSAAAAPAPAGGFGGFGTAAPAPAAGGFGGFGSPPAGAAGATSAFGAPAPAATPFGSPAPAPGGFGAAASGGFGAAPAPAPGGLFGGGAGAAGGFGSAATPGAAGGFGSTTPAGGFGSATSTGFGATGATTSAFGAPAPAPGGGLFGGAPAPTFGATGATTSAFGSPAPAPGGLFGSAPAAPAAGGGLFGGGATGKPGTLAVPYQVTCKTDGTTGTAMINIQAITAMPTYESKSLEELRLEDYMSGNKGSMGQPGAAAPAPGGFGGFGAPAPAPGAFGAQAPASGAFGAAPAPAAGGLFVSPPAAAPGAFGAPAPAPGGFGAAPAPAPLFGAAPSPAPGTFSFGSTASSPAPAPATGFGGFGAAAAPKPPGGGLFGSAPAPAPGGLFGSAPAPAPGGLFGSAPAPAPGGLFGSAPAPTSGGLFGSTPAPAPAPGGLFGASAPAPAGGGLFGAPPAPAPGGLFAPAPSPAGGGLFGAPPAPAPGGIFGGTAAPKPATGGIFGTPAPAAGGLFGAPAPSPAGGGLFGAPAAAPGGLFGTPAPSPAGGGLFGAPAPTSPFGAAPGVAPGAPYAVPAGVPPPTADAVLAQQLAAVERQKQELEQLETWRGGAPSGSSVIPASLSEKEASARSAAYGYGSGAKNGGTTVGVSTYAASSTALIAYQPSGAPRSGAKIRPRGFGPARATAAASVAGAGLIGTGGTGGSPLLSPDSFLGSSAKRLVIKPGSLTPKPKMRLQLTNGGASAGKAMENGGDVPEASASRPVEEDTAADEGVIHRAALDAVGPTPPAVAQTAPQIGVATPPTPAFASPEPATAVAAATPGKESTVASPSPVAATTADIERTPTEANKDARTPRSSAKKGTPGGVAYNFYQRVIGASDDAEAEASPSPWQMNGGKAASLPKAHLPKLTKAGYTISPSLDAMASLSEADLAAVSGFSVSRDGYGSVAWDGAVDVRGVDLDSAVTIEMKDVAVYDAEEAAGTKPPVGSKLNRPAVITMYGVYPKEGKDASEEAQDKFNRKIERSTKKMNAELISYDASGGIWKFRVKHFSRYGLFDDDTEDEEEEMDVVSKPVVSDGTTDQETEQDFERGDRGGRSLQQDKGARQTVTKKIGARSRIRAPAHEDEMSEQTDEESVALTSEGEASGMGVEAQVLQAADTAYAMMVETSSTTALVTVEPEFDEDMKRMGRKAPFGEERESCSEYIIGAPTPVEDVCTLRESGISARLSKKCGILATSSSTDFGLRMGRSFRVGWRPDGSFIVPSQVRFSSNSGVPSPGVALVQRRPVLNEDNSHENCNMRKELLETHLKHCVEVDNADDGCPFFALPKSIHFEEGTKLSYKSLCKALTDYSEAAKVAITGDVDPEVPNVVSRAFSLLSTLFGQEDLDFDSIDKDNLPSVDDTLADRRRREALIVWLRMAVSYDMKREVRQARDRGDVPAALLAAMSGCDVAYASSLAADHGYVRLSSLIASGGLQCRLDVRRQIEALHESGATAFVPPSLLRVYSLLGGDEGIEENLYRSGGLSSTTLDWRRRLALRLCCSDGVDKLSSLTQQYESDCARGVAPLPYPRYAANAEASGDVSCILYCLLRLWAREQVGGITENEVSISSIISPMSHTPSFHDFSMSFHLASTISSLDPSTQIAPTDMACLIDGYVMQLINAGCWEWAVYVCLCTGAGSTHLGELWRTRAIDIVARNCVRDTIVQRSFLEAKVGIPSKWFDNALAVRCAYVGDSIGRARYMSQLVPEMAMEAYEELMLPNVLFKGGAQKLMQTMEVLRNEDISGWKYLNEQGTIYQFLKVCEEVLNLSQLSQAERIRYCDRMGDLISLVRKLKKRSESDESMGRNGEDNIGNISVGMKSIPRSICMAELSSCLSLLEMQLLALCEGASIFEENGALEGRRLKLASQLAFLCCAPNKRTDFCFSANSLGAPDVLRGLYGVI